MSCGVPAGAQTPHSATMSPVAAPLSSLSVGTSGSAGERDVRRGGEDLDAALLGLADGEHHVGEGEIDLLGGDILDGVGGRLVGDARRGGADLLQVDFG